MQQGTKRRGGTRGTTAPMARTFHIQRRATETGCCFSGSRCDLARAGVSKKGGSRFVAGCPIWRLIHPLAGLRLPSTPSVAFRWGLRTGS